MDKALRFSSGWAPLSNRNPRRIFSSFHSPAAASAHMLSFTRFIIPLQLLSRIVSFTPHCSLHFSLWNISHFFFCLSKFWLLWKWIGMMKDMEGGERNILPSVRANWLYFWSNWVCRCVLVAAVWPPVCVGLLKRFGTCVWCVYVLRVFPIEERWWTYLSVCFLCVHASDSKFSCLWHWSDSLEWFKSNTSNG